MKCFYCRGKGCDYCRRTGRFLTAIDKDFYKRKEVTPIVTCTDGKNCDIIAQALLLYSKPGDTVIDVTYAHGNMWRGIDTSIYTFLPTDLRTGVDCRDLPYKDESIDIAVFDPPYMHRPNTVMLSKSYYNAETTPDMTHSDILDLYVSGMRELRRVLCPGGTMWVKCQDELESDVQRYTHIELYHLSLSLDLYPRDMFVLHNRTPTPVRGIQKHAKKNHSYLWIFEKR